MNRMVLIVRWIYGKLMELLPQKFKKEFKEEMKVVSSEMITAAAAKGKLAFASTCAKELYDLPILIMKTQLEEKLMIKATQIQIKKFAFRGAISYGLGFACVKEFAVVFTLLFISILGNRSGWFHVLIVTIGCFTASLVGGLLFAALFSERKQFGWFTLVGTLGWFIPFSTLYVQTVTYHDILLAGINLLPFLGFSLDGAFLSLALCVAKSKKRIFLVPLIITAVLVPILCYIIPKSFERSPTVDPAIINIIMDILLIVGAISLAVINNRKNLWIVIAGTLGLPIIYYLCIVLPGDLYRLLPASNGNPLSVSYNIYWILLWLPEGILFGLIISLIFGCQQLSTKAEA